MPRARLQAAADQAKPPMASPRANSGRARWRHRTNSPPHAFAVIDANGRVRRVRRFLTLTLCYRIDRAAAFRIVVRIRPRSRDRPRLDLDGADARHRLW